MKMNIASDPCESGTPHENSPPVVPLPHARTLSENIARACHLPYHRKISSEPVATPELNKDYIKGLAYSDAPDGEQRVRAYAQATMEQVYGQELGELRKHAVQIESNIVGVRRTIKDLTTLCDQTDPYHDHVSKSEPWYWFDSFSVFVLGLISIALPFVGLNTIATALMCSGLPIADKPLACYLFSLLPLLFPFAFKYLGPLLCNSPDAKRVYHIGIWTCSLLLGLVWLVLFSRSFPGITESVAEVIQGINLEGTATTQQAPGLFVIVSILAEGCFSGASWLTIESIVAKHRLCKRIANPAYEVTQCEISHWRQIESDETHYLGSVTGRITAIERAIHAFTLLATGTFHTARLANARQVELRNILK